jgi:hypothetical protein
MNDAKYQLDIIRMKLLSGEIPYDEAKKEAAPHLEAVNEKAAEIARKHGKKPHKFTFSEMMK